MLSTSLVCRSLTVALGELALCCWACQIVQAQAPQGPAAPATPTDVKTAASRGLTALQKAAAKYPEHRKCFSCHHQTLPMLAQITARTRGFDIESDLLQSQLEFTLKSFERQTSDLKKGAGIGGKGMTVAYGLWAGLLADAKPNETTESMVAYLLKTQRDEGHWTGQTCRPPLEESYLTCTVLAIQGIRKYSTGDQREATDAAIAKAKSWLMTAPAKSQEDKVARLWGLNLLGGPTEESRAARAVVLKGQRSDGGWGQLDEMDSDAYATGQTLFVLQATGLDRGDAAVQRGVQFLLKNQQPDGTWLVVSRSKPIQTYYDYDDEDPLGKNQFISVPATSWAVAALVATAARAD
jgi:N-acyl-D-amino-acid deacylase